jgi:hypothetical protein
MNIRTSHRKENHVQQLIGESSENHWQKPNLERRKTKTDPFSAASARVGKASRATSEQISTGKEPELATPYTPKSRARNERDRSLYERQQR